MATAEQLFDSAYQLFTQADSDNNGVIDQYEIILLTEKLVELHSASDIGTGRTATAKAVADAFEKFGGPDGIGFCQFVRLLTGNPWRLLLPDHDQQVLPKLLLRAARAEALGSGGLVRDGRARGFA